jgi:hypothetical protein
MFKLTAKGDIPVKRIVKGKNQIILIGEPPYYCEKEDLPLVKDHYDNKEYTPEKPKTGKKKEG